MTVKSHHNDITRALAKAVAQAGPEASLSVDIDDELNHVFSRGRDVPMNVKRTQVDTNSHLDDYDGWTRDKGTDQRSTPNYGSGIRLQAHPALGTPFSHAKVTIIPENQERYKDDPRFQNILPDGRVYATIGGGPTLKSDDWSYRSPLGNLESGVSWGEDTNLRINSYDELLTHPAVTSGEMTQDELIDHLFALESNYKEDLDYDLLPALSFWEDDYNSNGWAHGFLKASGFDDFKGPNNYGWSQPVPIDAFDSADPDEVDPTM